MYTYIYYIESLSIRIYKIQHKKNINREIDRYQALLWTFTFIFFVQHFTAPAFLRTLTACTLRLIQLIALRRY